ncbi:MAG: hypothetical protein NVS4B11_00470 [Ktedonobacteraceae bacterium]
MFDSTSRYYKLPTTKMDITNADGSIRQVTYVQRRIIPSTDGQTTVIKHIVAQEDRLDNLAARYLGDPLQFWRICDANNALSPNDLTDTIGDVVHIVFPRL